MLRRGLIITAGFLPARIQHALPVAQPTDLLLINLTSIPVLRVLQSVLTAEEARNLQADLEDWGPERLARGK